MADKRAEGPDRKSREEAALRRAVVNFSKLQSPHECIRELDGVMEALMVAGPRYEEEIASLWKVIGFLVRHISGNADDPAHSADHPGPAPRPV